MAQKSKPKQSGYRWWKFRQNMVLYSFKAALAMLFFSATAFLGNQVQIAIILLQAAKYTAFCIVLIIASQSYEVHATVIEDDFEEK